MPKCVDCNGNVKVGIRGKDKKIRCGDCDDKKYHLIRKRGIISRIIKRR